MVPFIMGAWPRVFSVGVFLLAMPFVRVRRVELRASSFVLEYIDGVKQFQEIPSQIFVSLECRFTRLNFVSLFFCRVV